MRANTRYANGWNCKGNDNYFSENKIDVIKYDDSIIEGTMKKQERPKNDKLKSSPKTKSKIYQSKN